jgi:DNA invertase Pin-like site-specific DNA recombinase
LTKEGIERARQRGVKLGGNPKNLKKGAPAMKAKANVIAMKWGPEIQKLRNEGKSYRECGELLNITTKKKTTMHPMSVYRIYKRYQKLMEAQ